MNSKLSFLAQKRTQAIARSLAIIGGTGALVVGATFAATNIGTATLTANTFAVGSGGVQVSLDNNTFAGTAAGFNFGSLTPGGTSPTRQHFWLKNGTASTIAISETAADVMTTGSLDKTKVKIHVEKTGTTTDDTASLDSLSTGTGLALSDVPAAGATNEYDVWVTLDSGALTSGTTANATFGLDFTGSTP